MTKHRRNNSGPGETRIGRRLAGFGLVLALLTMPVSYRGGSDLAHPHSFVQFLVDAAAGSMNHHVDKSLVGNAGHAGAGTHERVSWSTAPSGVPVLDQLGPANERASALGIALVAVLLLWAAGRVSIVKSETPLVGLAPRPTPPPPKGISAGI